MPKARNRIQAPGNDARRSKRHGALILRLVVLFATCFHTFNMSSKDKADIALAVEEKRNGEKGTIPMPATSAVPSPRWTAHLKTQIFVVILCGIFGFMFTRRIVHNRLMQELKQNADDLNWALEFFGGDGSDELSDFSLEWAERQFTQMDKEMDEIEGELAKAGFGKPPHKGPRRRPRRPLNGKLAEHIFL